MRFGKLGLGSAMLSLALIVAPWMAASDSAKAEKAPDPKGVIEKATANLAKATAKSSYNVVCNVVGGISKSKDHAVAATSVAANYDGDVFQGFMKMNKDVDAFRTPEKGAIRAKGKDFWQDLLSVKPEGTYLARLFNFPHLVLESALDKPERIEWIWVGDEMEEEEETADESEPTDEPTGRTGVAPGGKEKSGKSTRGIPHKMRVTLKPDVAVRMFTEAQNSDCFGGG